MIINCNNQISLEYQQSEESASSVGVYKIWKKAV